MCRSLRLPLLLALLLSAGGTAMAQETASPGHRPFSAWTRSSEPAPAQPPNAPNTFGQLGQLTQTPEATLGDIFKALATRQREVRLNLWFPGADFLSEAEIAQGAAVAEGVALRTGQAPVITSAVPGIVPGCFNVVIGSVDQLGNLLQPGDLRDASNGFLILRRLPNRPDTHILLIVGRTPAGLESAILTLGIAREQLPGASTAAIQSVILPKAPPFLRREPLRSDTLYTFQDLQEAGAAMLLLPNGNLRLEFMLPGDYTGANGGHLKLDLHYTLKSQLFRGTDRVSVTVNRHAEPQTGPILPGRGSEYLASVDLPTSLFAPGRNVVEIAFSSAGILGAREDFQILSDSTLTLPACVTPPTLPDLNITARTVYPLIGQPDGSEIAVCLGDIRKETIESAWTFLAKLAQMSNTLLYGAEFVVGGYVGNKHVIAIGAQESLSEEFRKEIPPAIFSDAPVASPTPDKTHGTNLKDLLFDLRSDVRETLFEPPPALAGHLETSEPTPQTGNRLERGYLGSFPPKEAQHGWLLVLTAPTPALLAQRTAELVTPEFWEKIAGENLYWNHSPESVQTYTDPARTPVVRYSGEEASWFEIEMPLGERYHVYPWIVACAITLILLILTTYNALVRLQRSGGFRR